MLRIVLLAFAIALVGGAMLPEAAAWDPCQPGSGLQGTPVLCGTSCHVHTDGWIHCD